MNTDNWLTLLDLPNLLYFTIQDHLPRGELGPSHQSLIKKQCTTELPTNRCMGAFSQLGITVLR